MNIQSIYKTIHEILITIFIKHKSIIDFAVLGSSSGKYGWKDTRFCDFDIWIFCLDINNIETSLFLQDLTTTISQSIVDVCIIAEAVNGPYKPSIWNTKEIEVLFLHYLVDDKKSYSKRTIFTQLSWSKYEAYNDKLLLKDLFSNQPKYKDLLNSNCGINSAIKTIQNGIISYESLDFYECIFNQKNYNHETTQFIEYLTHTVMMISRNRSRLDQHTEPDKLNNYDFSLWYCSIYNDSTPMQIEECKSGISQCGYGFVNDINALKIVVFEWLHTLKNTVESGVLYEE